MPLSITKPILFGSFTVTSQVFHLTSHSYAFVNLKPILPGHVLVSPIRRVPRLHDLTAAEVSDLFQEVQRVGRMVERVFHASALNIAIQDGSDAGQSVPHVHAHILPRKPADLPNTDDIYKELDGPAGDIGQHLEHARKGAFPTVDADEARHPRTAEEMNKEAEWLTKEMEKEAS
ncbi:putative Bis-tetraphosphatase [Microthyrium microscopicum]|uniref:Bis(5'-adenosyl)-triphosphatase n=1 Tax=Microthyrium microscopicum TaxID=703497 RepID=A0A6A6UPK1_9PEZI|nr:putative Bis-tetraphosphatase [Microthyrium microscopicum]